MEKTIANDRLSSSSDKFHNQDSISRINGINKSARNMAAFDEQALKTSWDQIGGRNGEGSENRYEKCDLIRKYASAGNYNEVLSFILENSNPGDLRGAYLRALFTTPSDLPLKDLLSSINRLVEMPDKKASLAGLIQALTTADVAFKFSEFSYIDPKTYGYEDVLKAFAADYLNRNAFENGDAAVIANFNEVAGELNSLRKSKSIGDSFYYSTLSSMVDSNQVAATALFDWLSATSTLKDAPKDLINKAVRNSSAHEGLAFLDSLEKANIVDGGIWATAFTELAKLDETALRQWKDMSELRDGEVQNAYYLALSDKSLATGDLNAARDIAKLISDPAEREKMDGRIWSIERDSLRKEVGKDPAGTVQSIVSGQSKYGDYWLEEAMGTWVAKDFDQAQNWYQQNWNTMPAAKSQYVAAAFANQAVQQGDLATARQWAAYIQDAKTKQRIDAGITKAEGQAHN